MIETSLGRVILTTPDAGTPEVNCPLIVRFTLVCPTIDGVQPAYGLVIVAPNTPFSVREKLTIYNLYFYE